MGRGLFYTKKLGMEELLVKLSEYIENQDERSFFGMCETIEDMHGDLIITNDEHLLLYGFLKEKRLMRNAHVADYWWKFGEKQPRLDWIAEQIEKL